MKISFLIHNVYGVGGTNRAVINLATELARQHDVEIVSVFRRVARPMLHIPDSVRVRALVDTRPGSRDRADLAQRQRSVVVPGEEEFYAAYSRLTDARLQSYLETSGRDVYVGTRAALNLALARWGPAGAVLVAQEHQTHATLPPALRAAMQAAYSRLSAAVTVTETDAVAFRELTPVPGVRICAVPNTSPAAPLPTADTASRILIAAGRLDPVKQYDVLLHAFRSVVDRHPDWSLRIYGAGPQSGPLRALVTDLRLNDHVLLMGRHARMETEWVKGAMLVSSSERESFGMSIVEAMRAGLPVVSTRAPVGPEEIIRDGDDGLLVPVGDVAGLAEAITTLVEEPDMRRRMGQRAAQNAARFDPARVAAQYDAIFRELAATSARRSRRNRPWRWPASAAASIHQIAATLHGRLSDRGQVVAMAPRIDVALDRTNGLCFGGDTVGASWRRLVLVHRELRTEVVVDLGPAGQHGAAQSGEPTSRVEGRLDAATTLAEGRWNVYVESADGTRSRAAAGLFDTRNAIALPLSDEPVARRLPYETADRFLAVRAWLRPRHAEIDGVQALGGELHVSGRLAGHPQEGGDPTVRLVASCRLSDVPELAEEPVRPSAAGRFDVLLDLDRLAEHRVTRHDDWDLYLEHIASGGRVRLARLADDIADRKPVIMYDFTRCDVATDPAIHEESPQPTVEVRPYITVDSDLSLYVRER
jgi:glycosyltransferase involved in cell wall biosynthesis